MAPIQNVLIVDTETTGLSPEEGTCIEVGAILFNVEQRSVVAQLSFVLPCLLNSAYDINKISPLLTTIGPDPEVGVLVFKQLMAHADALVAHNAEFDRQWFGLGVLPDVELPWICTMSDVPWPKGLGLKGRPSVAALALAHGVPVWAAHRALTDCIYLAQVFERCEDLEAILQSALLPRFTYQAVVSYDEKELAKQAGFSWNNAQKRWLKRMTEAEAGELSFAVKRVN
jgi:DNA polymerase-3 subunit epsilon